MQIDKDSVVQFHYTLTELDGSFSETSDRHQPMAYLHGHNNIIRGLEKALQGKQAGEHVSAVVSPEDAYGLRNSNGLQRVPLKHIHNHRKVRAGMTAMIETDNGPRQVSVIKVGKFMADIDTNHPLAGKTLQFEIDIVSVRAATAEEVQHGHAHGDGGHHH